MNLLKNEKRMDKVRVFYRKKRTNKKKLTKK